MKKDFVINTLIHSPPFAKKVAAPAGIQGSDAFTLHGLPDGQYKIAYRLRAGDNVSLAVKEMRFYGPNVEDNEREYGHSVEAWGMDVFSSLHAIYEIQTLRMIAKASAKEARHFPIHKADFCYIHPEFDGYTEEAIAGGQFTAIPKAVAMLDNYHGASFLTVDEFIDGRAPTNEELAEAHRLRAEGIKRNPRLWLTVDVDRNDVIVRPNNDIVFIDHGKFNDLSRDEERMLEQFMREDEQNNAMRPRKGKTRSEGLKSNCTLSKDYI